MPSSASGALPASVVCKCSSLVWMSAPSVAEQYNMVHDAKKNLQKIGSSDRGAEADNSNRKP